MTARTILRPEPEGDVLGRVFAAWTRLGVWFSVTPTSTPVDVEVLLARTAMVARADERLFVGVVSWLSTYHGWVNGRRLIAVMAELARRDRVASAVAGALLSVAAEAARATHAGRALELEGAIERCRALTRPRPMFEVMERFPQLRTELRHAALPAYRRWGLWHDEQVTKPTAIRSASWLIRHVPELRIRALVGPSLEADLVTLALTGPLTAQALATATGVSYAAAHGAADRLVARGVMRRERAGARQLLHLTPAANTRLGSKAL